MKNSIFLIAIGLVLLTGCSKDESNEQITDQSIDSVSRGERILGLRLPSGDGESGVESGRSRALVNRPS